MSTKTGPKHIVIDARELRTSTGRYAERLIHYLQDIDTVNRYSILLIPKDMEGWKPRNPNFHKVACPYKEFTFAEQLAYYRLLMSLKADLVHFPMIQQPILYPGRVVTTIQDLTTIRFRNPSKNWLIFTVKQQVYKIVTQIVARKSRRLITPTEYVQQDVVQYTHVKPSKITVTLEAADTIPDTSEPIKALKGKPYIMYLGRPLPHKNLRRLIEAFVILKKDHPDLHLVLGGKKDTLYEQHAQYVADNNISDVLFTGFVSEGELKWLYQNTACYVFPSLSEGFGLPALEAMLHKAPVASSDLTCLPEVYKDGVIYFNPLEPENIAKVIHRVLTDSNLANKLRTRGYERAICFSWKKMANSTFSVYQDALK